VKALFRRAKANSGAWNPQEAKSDFERVIELDSSLEGVCRKEIKKLEDLEKVKNQEDKKKFSGLF
jgi:AH receptor-interacting protein